MTTSPRLVAPESYFARLCAGCAADWQAYVAHPFVQQLGAGSLPEASFRHYLIQDYLFLVHFARAYGLAIYKADNLADMRAAAATVNALLDVEMRLHVDYCAGWGISETDMLAAPEAGATMAYTRYVLERGMAGDSLDLMVALAPCVVGYGEIGAALAAAPGTRRENNPYSSWIDMYAGQDYREVAVAAAEQLDRLAAERLTPGRETTLQTTFRQATRLEAAFWEMGLTLAT